jgi:hypothetical protein
VRGLLRRWFVNHKVFDMFAYGMAVEVHNRRKADRKAPTQSAWLQTKASYAKNRRTGAGP